MKRPSACAREGVARSGEEKKSDEIGGSFTLESVTTVDTRAVHQGGHHLAREKKTQRRIRRRKRRTVNLESDE